MQFILDEWQQLKYNKSRLTGRMRNEIYTSLSSLAAASPLLSFFERQILQNRKKMNTLAIVKHEEIVSRLCQSENPESN